MTRADEPQPVALPIDEPVGAVLSFETAPSTERTLVRSGLLVSVVVVVSNLMNVGFHFATARLLGREEYSLLTTMFAVFMIGTVPLLAVQATVTREMSACLGAGEPREAALVLKSSLVAVLRWAVIMLALGIVALIPLVFLLNVDRLLPVLAVTFAFFLQVPQPIVGGGLAATDRFHSLSWMQLVQSSLKLMAGVGLAAIGLGAAAITFGVGVAIGAGLLVALWALRPLLEATTGHPLPAQRIIGRYALGAAFVLGAHTVLTQVDLIWARATLGANEAGLYAAASVITSIMLIVPIGVTTVLFPRVARLRSHRSGDRYLAYGAGIVSVLCLLGVVFLAAFPLFVLHLTLGHQYDAAANWLWLLGIAMGCYAVMIVYLNHFLALGRTAVLWVLAGVVALQQVLFLTLHATGRDIVNVQVITAAVGLVAVAVYDRLTIGPGQGADG